MRNKAIVISSLLLLSCSKDINSEKKISNTEKSFIDRCKEFIIEPDEMKSIRREAYLKDMLENYNDYEFVLEFFTQKNNPFILEENGSLYKIIDSQIDDAGSKSYNYEDQNLVKYFYVTESNYYIYSFNYVNNNSIEFIGLRRLEKGFFKTKMHDLIFSNEKLIKENLVGKFATDFYDEDGIQKFEFSNKVNGDKIINTFNLGTVKDF